LGSGSHKIMCARPPYKIAHPYERTAFDQTVFSLHISTFNKLISGNYSVLSIAKASKHSQVRHAQAMRLRDTEGSALRANRSHVAQTKEVMLCVHSISLPSTVQLSALTGCSPCSTS